MQFIQNVSAPMTSKEKKRRVNSPQLERGSGGLVGGGGRRRGNLPSRIPRLRARLAEAVLKYKSPSALFSRGVGSHLLFRRLLHLKADHVWSTSALFTILLLPVLIGKMSNVRVEKLDYIYLSLIWITAHPICMRNCPDGVISRMILH